MPTLAVVLGWSRLLGARSRQRHRLGEARRSRARPGAAPAASAERHHRRPHAHHRDHRQRARQGRAGLFPSASSPTRRRRNDRHCHANQLLPRRRRLRRPTAPGAAAASDSRSRARYRLRSPTRPETALIYRLCGDPNPLHVDPAFANAAGFPKPVLHGLATFGIAAHSMIKSLCGYDPSKSPPSPPVFPRRCFRARASARKSGARAMRSASAPACPSVTSSRSTTAGRTSP